MHQRERTGRGQMVDMALFDVMTGTLANQAMNYLASGRSPKRMGNAHPNIAPYEAFEAKDGWLIVAVGNDRQFTRFAKVIDLPLRDEWATNSRRVTHREPQCYQMAWRDIRENGDASRFMKDGDKIRFRQPDGQRPT